MKKSQSRRLLIAALLILLLLLLLWTCQPAQTRTTSDDIQAGPATGQTDTVTPDPTAELIPVQLSAVLAEGADPLDGIDVVWNIYRTQDGQLVDQEAVYKGVTWAPKIQLAAGSYQVQAGLGLAKTYMPIVVSDGEENAFTVNMNAAVITANYKLSDSTGIGTKDLRWDLRSQPSAEEEAISTVVLSPSALFYVPPGTYDLLGGLDSGNSASARLTVEAGQVYERTLNMDVGELSVALFLTDDIPLGNNSVFWSLTAQTEDGTKGASWGPFAGNDRQQFEAPTGQYTVFYKMYDIYSGTRDVKIKSGTSDEIKIVMNAGYIKMLTQGPTVQYGFAALSRKDANGDYQPAFRISSSNLSFYTYVFPAGDYRLVAKGYSGQTVEAEFTVTAGERTETTIVFP